MIRSEFALSSTSENPPLPTFPLGRTAVALTCVVGGAAAVVTAALLAIGRDGGFAELWLAAGICMAAAVLSLLPIRAAGRNANAVGMAAMAGSLVRVALTAALVALAALAMPAIEATSLVVWALLWYLLLLAAEIALIVRHLHSIEQAMKERVA